MTVLAYRLVGSTSNPILTKDFETHADAVAWAQEQGNVFIVEIDSTT